MRKKFADFIDKDVIGAKVIPFQKTVGCDWEEFFDAEYDEATMFFRDNGFLYVNEIDMVSRTVDVSQMENFDDDNDYGWTFRFDDLLLFENKEAFEFEE